MRKSVIGNMYSGKGFGTTARLLKEPFLIGETYSTRILHFRSEWLVLYISACSNTVINVVSKFGESTSCFTSVILGYNSESNGPISNLDRILALVGGFIVLLAAVWRALPLESV